MTTQDDLIAALAAGSIEAPDQRWTVQVMHSATEPAAIFSSDNVSAAAANFLAALDAYSGAVVTCEPMNPVLGAGR
jgi:hypothetical protein